MIVCLSMLSNFITYFARNRERILDWMNFFGMKWIRFSTEENELLEAELTEDEFKKANDDSYAAGAPGPDDFSFLFYQKFWPLIKNNFMSMVRDFETGKANVARLNYATVILIPKEDDARTLKKFRPISLINYSFKIFFKALNTRLEAIYDGLLAPNQSIFVKGRYILESVVAAHEIIHKTVKGGRKGLF
jgi:hypothetical protein